MLPLHKPHQTRVFLWLPANPKTMRRDRRFIPPCQTACENLKGKSEQIGSHLVTEGKARNVLPALVSPPTHHSWWRQAEMLSPSSFDLPVCPECEIRGTSSVTTREPCPSAWKAAVSARPKQRAHNVSSHGRPLEELHDLCSLLSSSYSQLLSQGCFFKNL